MCVIILAEDSFPKPDTLRSAEALNSHGAGVAWVNEFGSVSYRKNLDAEEIITMIETGVIKLPAIIHFRIASVGAVKPELCHPFPIEDNSGLALVGDADAVLFHNGTWSEWNEHLMNGVISGELAVPDGASWSDSRAMAVLANRYGYNILNLIKGNKITVLDAKGIHKFGDGWVTVDGHTCSNNYFVPKIEKEVSNPYSFSFSKKKDKKNKKKNNKQAYNFWTDEWDIDSDDEFNDKDMKTNPDLDYDDYGYLWDTLKGGNV